MFVGKNKKKETFIVVRCVYFYAQAEDAASQRSCHYVSRETTVVPPLPTARPNRAETLQYRQTEGTRQNYRYLLQMSDNTFEQNDQRSRTRTKRGRYTEGITSEKYARIADP